MDRDSRPTRPVRSTPRALLFGLALLAGPALAADERPGCFASSAALAPDREPFEEPDSRELSVDEARHVAGLIRRLTRAWRGDGDGFDCDGSEAAPRLRPDRLRVELDAQGGAGFVELRGRVGSLDHGWSLADGLRIELDGQRLLGGDFGLAVPVEVLEVGPDRLSFVLRSRIAIAHRGSDIKAADASGIGTPTASESAATRRGFAIGDSAQAPDRPGFPGSVPPLRPTTLWEKVKRLRLAGNRLEIIHDHYRQGVLVSSATWRLTPTDPWR